MDSLLNKKVSVPFAIIVTLIIVTIVVGITYDLSLPNTAQNITSMSKFQQIKEEKLHNIIPVQGTSQ